ncbi:hypothetical protein [Ruminococcus albus]|uniref:FHA domain-containing protein n=1 Tax=Ruminococcus albus TaxID=1264 RepID=A0A1H7JHB2_RUMAL|nr:hypothetical protein [Ruminococcus albus]SEK73943.1 hypothetical protein SAMN05216469_10557 [Ruminococcus albus]
MDLNNMQFSWQYSPEQKFQLKPRLARGERSVGGGLWCVALLPLAGIVLESFAVDKYSGAVLWLTVIFMIFFGCRADLKHYDLNNADVLDDTARKSLAKAVWIPPLYLYRRDKMRRAGATKCAVLVILTAAAIFSNGFVQGLTVNEKNVPDRLENTPVSVMGFDTSDDDKTVGKMLESWFDDGAYECDCTHSGDIYELVYSGRHGKISAEVTVNVEHDGFIFKDITAEGITIDGKELKDDELKDMQKEIFLGDEAEEESEAAEEDSEK